MNGPKNDWNVGWNQPSYSDPSLAPGYEKKEYHAGDVITVGNKVMIANTDILTPEEYDKSHWDEINIAMYVRSRDVATITKFIDDGTGGGETRTLTVSPTDAAMYEIGNYYGINDVICRLQGKITVQEGVKLVFVVMSGVAQALDEIVANVTKAFKYIGEAAVSYLNDTIPGLESGWTYTVTDSGTLVAGNLEVIAGDEVAWSGITSTWVKVGGDDSPVSVITFNTAYPDGSLVDHEISDNKKFVILNDSMNTPDTTNTYMLNQMFTDINERIYVFECQVNHTKLTLSTTDMVNWTWSLDSLYDDTLDANSTNAVKNSVIFSEFAKFNKLKIVDDTMTFAQLESLCSDGYFLVFKKEIVSSAYVYLPVTMHSVGTGFDFDTNYGFAIYHYHLNNDDTSTFTTEYAASVSHDHSASDITSGKLAIARGGTNAGTAAEADYNICNPKCTDLGSLPDSSTGDDYRVMFASTSPSTTNGVFTGFRKVSAIWTWIKSKLGISSNVGSNTRPVWFNSGKATACFSSGIGNPYFPCYINSSGSVTKCATALIRIYIKTSNYTLPSATTDVAAQTLVAVYNDGTSTITISGVGGSSMSLTANRIALFYRWGTGANQYSFLQVKT